MQLKTNDEPHKLINLACILIPFTLLCGALLAQIGGSSLGKSIYAVIVMGVFMLVPAGLIGLLSKSRKIKSATFSVQFGLLLGMTVALAYSAFIWHIDQPQSVLIVGVFAAMRGAALLQSLRP